MRCGNTGEVEVVGRKRRVESGERYDLEGKGEKGRGEKMRVPFWGTRKII